MKRYEENWVTVRKPGNVAEIMHRFGISDVFARLLWNRGYCTEQDVAGFLYPETELAWPRLYGTDTFVRVMREAVAEGGKFRVVGDYDVDGVTATYLMVTALRMLGADADYRIPDRVADGYGISSEMIRTAHADGVRTIVTVDNGIAAVEQCRIAKSLGIRMIVTDHHEPQAELPETDCTVDPKAAPEGKRYENLCGAVVAALLADALLETYGMNGYAKASVEVLALATVCDVMLLTGVARDIVRRGLAKPVSTWNAGLRALIAANGIEGKVRNHHLGFILGPCINALGRLETADPGVELLLGSDEAALAECARRMVSVNDQRKDQSELMTDEAVRMADTMIAAGGDDPVLILYLPQCHESLAGIVAGRVRERFQRPAFVLTDTAKDAELVKGSGRSTESFSMFDGMMECRDLFDHFGGHAAAAGVTMPKANIEAFRRAMADAFAAQEATLKKKITIDLVLPFRCLTIPLTEELSLLEPFGNGNPKPVFAQKDVTIQSLRYIGRDSRYLAMVLRDSDGTQMRGVYFGDAAEFTEEYAEAFGNASLDAALAGRGNERAAFLYYPERHEYNGNVSVQIQVTGYHFTK